MKLLTYDTEILNGLEHLIAKCFTRDESKATKLGKDLVRLGDNPGVEKVKKLIEESNFYFSNLFLQNCQIKCTECETRCDFAVEFNNHPNKVIICTKCILKAFKLLEGESA